MDEADFNREVACIRRRYAQRRSELDLPTYVALSYDGIVDEAEQLALLDYLIMEAETWKHYWDAVNLIARRQLRAGNALPPPLANWIKDVLADQFVRKQKEENATATSQGTAHSGAQPERASGSRKPDRTGIQGDATAAKNARSLRQGRVRVRRCRSRVRRELQEHRGNLGIREGIISVLEKLAKCPGVTRPGIACSLRGSHVVSLATPPGGVMETPSILRIDEVLRLTGLSKATVYRLMGVGLFPGRVLLSSRAVGWRKHEVSEWLDNRPRAGGAPVSSQ